MCKSPEKFLNSPIISVYEDQENNEICIQKKDIKIYFN
jgi:hypothetical protein